jgi:hypothetical protein
MFTPPPVIDLMAALKRSLAQDTPAISGTTARKSEPGPQPIGASDRSGRRLFGATKSYERCVWPCTPSHELWSSHRSFVF